MLHRRFMPRTVDAARAAVLGTLLLSLATWFSGAALPLHHSVAHGSSYHDHAGQGLHAAPGPRGDAPAAPANDHAPGTAPSDCRVCDLLLWGGLYVAADAAPGIQHLDPPRLVLHAQPARPHAPLPRAISPRAPPHRL